MYLRIVAIGPRGRKRSAPTPSVVSIAVAVSAVAVSGGVMAGAGLLEDAGDHLFQRRILYAEVQNRMTVKYCSQHLADPGALHLEIGRWPLPACDFAVPLEVVGHRAVGEFELHQFRRA